MRAIQSVCLCLTLIAMIGCGNNGSEFLGKWKTVAPPHTALEIDKEGKVFLIKSPQVNFFGPSTISTTAATITKDDTLEFQTGFGVSSITYIKSTNHLLVPEIMGSVEYSRAQ